MFETLTLYEQTTVQDRKGHLFSSLNYNTAVISKMFKYAEINILEITVEHLDITTEQI